MNEPSLFQVVFFDIGNTLIGNKAWLPGAKTLIGALKQKGIRVGIISNTGNLDRNKLERLLPGDFDFGVFDESLVMLSSETGIEKPKLDAFLLAVQHAGCSPWQTAFVGESLEETLAAQRAGMHAVRIGDPKSDFEKLLKLLA